MRRLLLLLLLLPSLCEAKGLVVINRLRNSAFSAAVQNRQTWQSDNAERLTRELLDRFNVDYRIVPASQVNTTDCRSGQLVRNRGTSSAAVESFDWVLHVAYGGKACKSARWIYPAYRPDSLHMSVTADAAANKLLVPQLFWNMQLNGATPTTFLADTTGDTTGLGSGGAMSLSQPNGCQFPPYAVDYTGRHFLESSYIGSPTVTASVAPNVGFRVLSGKRSGGASVVTGMEAAMFSAAPPQTVGWADSNATFAVGIEDGVMEIWEMPFANISGSKSCVFADVWGTSGCTDSTGTSNATPCEWDTQNALLSLARIDSLTSGGVFGRTLGLGCVIKGGFKRSGVGNPGGISPADTTALKNTLDSLATLGSRFKCLVTADMDSVWARVSERGWWEKLPGLRYTPTAEACVYDSTTGQCRGGSGSKWLWPIDVFGKYRNRAAKGTYTDSTYVYNQDDFHSSSNADSSVYFMVRSLFFHADSTFGRERVSRFLVPPADDWSPRPASGTATVLTADSMIYAMSKAGAIGMLYNSQKRTTPAVMVGYPRHNDEMIVNSTSGRPFLLLGHSGYACNGGRLEFDVRDDSVNWSGGVCQTNGFNRTQYTYPALSTYEVHRAINQLVFNRYRDIDFMMRARYTDPWDDVNTPTDDAVNAIRRGSVWVTSAQELGGGGHLAAGYSATRPAWWTIKSLDQYMLALNKWAGRTVITWAYPENIVP